MPPFNKVTFRTYIDRILDILFYAIHNFMVLQSTESGRKVKNFRCLDSAAKHYDAEPNSRYADINLRIVLGGRQYIDETTVYIKGSCGASMKKTVFVVYIYLFRRKILAQSCSHIWGLLFAVGNITTTDVKQSGQGEDSCTSKLCQWEIPTQRMAHLWNIPDKVPEALCE
ncbi:hypothetical protein KUTeg_017599 [Tegillarca granosa]|uniref:Uncharacterized protein n=1 Tax=Tegillarca granosa TaxID=220873 RepID=A0ABQ9EJF6_TEGGR|nr:hypothetical protein KUTeg_017599 [Tegillarca granosa]